MGLALKPILRDYSDRLSSGWADLAIVQALLLGELGAILFSLAAGIFQGAPFHVGRFCIRPTKWIFRAAAVICAGFALLANITITALHTQDLASLPVYGWFMAVVPPVVVLFVGLFIEHLLLTFLEARTSAKEAYDRAYDEWNRIQREPESHPEFRAIWNQEILDQLRKVSRVNRDKTEAAPELRADLVRREFQRHEWASFAVELPEPRPTMLPAAAVSLYPLPSEISTSSPNGSLQQ